ncbi:MAG TPA: 3TM-type holin [Burkholderiales bacterium]|nr:3TM-type holin [Burkholderiales bacterium]
MSFLSGLLGAGDVVRAVSSGLDKLLTSDDERLEKRLEIVKAEREFRLAAMQVLGKSDEKQADTNIEEIRSGSLFMAGWRPAIGWIGVFALGYQFVLYPFLLWLHLTETPPPPLDAGVLFSMVTGMLGIGAMRSFDKMRETDTQIIGRAPPK